MTEDTPCDLSEIVNTLSQYVKGDFLTDGPEERQNPLLRSKPDVSKLKPLRKLDRTDEKFVAVDCSTRTLRRANNWGIYLLRTTYTLIEGRKVD